jgi:HSP90 family molecular chaperone
MDGKPYENPLAYHKYLTEKSLPDAWNKKFRLTAKRLKRFYKTERGISHPLFDIILERVASLATKVEYYESKEYAITYKTDIHHPTKGSEFNFLTSTLNKSMEQMMKYTEKKASQVGPKRRKLTETISIDGEPKEVKKLTDEQIFNRVNQIIGESSKRVRVTATRTAETEDDEEEDLDKRVHRKVSMDKG